MIGDRRPWPKKKISYEDIPTFMPKTVNDVLHNELLSILYQLKGIAHSNKPCPKCRHYKPLFLWDNDFGCNHCTMWHGEDVDDVRRDIQLFISENFNKKEG